MSFGRIGYALAGWRLALISGGTFVWIAVMGQWKWAMETLSVIVVAAPLSIALGLAVGTLAWRSRLAERIVNPPLNIPQSLPPFVDSIPVVLFIWDGSKAGATRPVFLFVPTLSPCTRLGL